MSVSSKACPNNELGPGPCSIMSEQKQNFFFGHTSLTPMKRFRNYQSNIPLTLTLSPFVHTFDFTSIITGYLPKLKSRSLTNSQCILCRTIQLKFRLINTENWTYQNTVKASEKLYKSFIRIQSNSSQVTKLYKS